MFDIGTSYHRIEIEPNQKGKKNAFSENILFRATATLIRTDKVSEKERKRRNIANKEIWKINLQNEYDTINKHVDATIQMERNRMKKKKKKRNDGSKKKMKREKGKWYELNLQNTHIKGKAIAIAILKSSFTHKNTSKYQTQNKKKEYF